MNEPVWVDSVGSTNQELKNNIRQGVDYPSGYILSACEQTAGRGRFERRWIARKGQSLTFSLVLTTTKTFPEIATIPLAVGLGVCKYMQNKGIEACGKWPNDVLVGDNKICGILSEKVAFGQKEYIIVGIGINLNMSQEEARLIDKPATSIFIESGQKVDQKESLAELRPYIDASLATWDESGFPGIRPEWEKVAWRFEEEVELDNSGIIISGILAGFGESGQLLLKLPGGVVKEFWSGDVSIKRER